MPLLTERNKKCQFKEEIPEGIKFYEIKEKENFIDKSDDIHMIFCSAIVPYIFHIVMNGKDYTIKIFL